MTFPKDALAGQLGLESDIELELNLVMEFKADQTMRMYLPEEGKDAFVASIRTMVETMVTEMLKAQATESGMSWDDFLAAMEAQGVTLSSYIDDAMASFDVNMFNVDGTYSLKDGKLYIVAGEDDDEEGVPYTFVNDNTLKLDFSETEDDAMFGEVTLTRK